jgi:HEAT repeat protein
MIDPSVDQPGHSLRTLVWQALRTYRTEHLFPFLLDRDVIVRTIAARELQVRGTLQVFEHVIQLAGQDRHVAREVAAFVLGQLGLSKRPYRNRSFPVLAKLAEDAHPSVRSAAIASLGHLRLPRSLPAVVQAAQDRVAPVRLSAAFALGKFKKTPETVRLLRKLARDKHPQVREWATFSLEGAPARSEADRSSPSKTPSRHASRR